MGCSFWNTSGTFVHLFCPLFVRRWLERALHAAYCRVAHSLLYDFHRLYKWWCLLGHMKCTCSELYLPIHVVCHPLLVLSLLTFNFILFLAFYFLFMLILASDGGVPLGTSNCAGRSRDVRAQFLFLASDFICNYSACFYLPRFASMRMNGDNAAVWVCVCHTVVTPQWPCWRRIDGVGIVLMLKNIHVFWMLSTLHWPNASREWTTKWDCVNPCFHVWVGDVRDSTSTWLD